jgi:hypothetical protein
MCGAAPWFARKGVARVANPFRYHAFDCLYQVLLTELSSEIGSSGGGRDAFRDELKGGLQGFLREAVVMR